MSGLHKLFSNNPGIKATYWGFISRTQNHNSDFDITLEKIDIDNMTY